MASLERRRNACASCKAKKKKCEHTHQIRTAMKETHPRPKAPLPRTPRRPPATRLGTAPSSPARMSFNSGGSRMVSDESNALINQSKKEAFLRTNISVKLPAWMIEKRTELLPLSAYSPKRMHHKNQAYATPETGSSSGGSASDPRALHESPVIRKSTSRNLSEYQLAPISPQGSRNRLQKAPRDVGSGEPARSQSHDDDGPVGNDLSGGCPTTDEHNLQRVNQTQVDRTTASGTTDRRAEINRYLAQHVGGSVRDGLAPPQAADKPPVIAKPLETHKSGAAIAKSPNNAPAVIKPTKTLGGEEKSMTKSPSKALVVARPRGMRVEDALQTRSPMVAKLTRIPEEEVSVTQSPIAANPVTTNRVEASMTQSLTQTPNEASVVVESLGMDKAGTEIAQSSKNAPVVPQPMETREEIPSMTKPPGEAPLVTGPVGTDGVRSAMVQSLAQPAGSWNFRSSAGRKERIVIIIDDDETEADDPDSGLQNPAQTDDDDTQSGDEEHGRIDVLESGGKSITGRKCPSITHKDGEAGGQEIPEREWPGKPTAEAGMENEQVHHTKTRGATPPEAAINEVQEPQGREATIVSNPHTSTSIESGCLSRGEISNASNLQETVHNVQPIVIIIDDDDEEGEKDEDDMESEYYEEIVSPFDLRASVQFNDELQIPPSSSASEPSNTSAASTATSEPSIASAASSPRKRIKLTQFTQPAGPSSAPTPLLKLDRSRWNAPNRATHRRFSGPMILTPLRITPFPAGLGEVDHSGRSHYPLSNFDLPANANPKTPNRKRQRRHIGSVKE